jgi:ABC-2 type transport system permease protein
METTIPKISTVFTALLKSDFTVLWRNRRAVMLSIIMPAFILIMWKGLIPLLGGPYTMANSLSYGLIATTLLGYANTLARDREKGIFQRLRVAPIPGWAIMVSRLTVQLIMIIIITTVIFIVGNNFDKITLSAEGYALTYFVAVVGAAVYLSVGQLIVGLIKNAETVNTTSRFVFVIFIMAGMFATIYSAQHKSSMVAQITHWSPYGAVNTMISAGMVPDKWGTDATYALLATIGYIIVFGTIGIQKFKWDSK